jgi:hypothetical protein
VAAVASKRAAELYGLEALDEGIQVCFLPPLTSAHLRPSHRTLAFSTAAIGQQSTCCAVLPLPVCTDLLRVSPAWLKHLAPCVLAPLQDNTDNVTRFILLAREPLVVYNPEPGAYKTTIVFSMQEGPGQLYKARPSCRCRV